MSLAWNGQEIAGLSLNGSAVSACYNGELVWPAEQPVYTLTVTSDQYGSANAEPVTGHAGDTSQLSYTNKSAWYGLSGWSINNGTVAGNVYTFGDGDATASAVSKKSAYYEKLLWSGDAYTQNATLALNEHPSAYDDIRVVCGGANSIGNSLLYESIQIPYDTLKSINCQYFELPMFGSTAADGVTRGWFFGGILTGCSGTSWRLSAAMGREFNSNRVEYRYDFFRVKQIWGIHYG